MGRERFGDTQRAYHSCLPHSDPATIIYLVDYRSRLHVIVVVGARARMHAIHTSIHGENGGGDFDLQHTDKGNQYLVQLGFRRVRYIHTRRKRCLVGFWLATFVLVGQVYTRYKGGSPRRADARLLLRACPC